MLVLGYSTLYLVINKCEICYVHSNIVWWLALRLIDIDVFLLEKCFRSVGLFVLVQFISWLSIQAFGTS